MREMDMDGEGGGQREEGGGRALPIEGQAREAARYLLEGRLLITSTWAGLLDGFMKTTPLNAKAWPSPPPPAPHPAEVSRPHKGPPFPCAPDTRPAPTA